MGFLIAFGGEICILFFFCWIICTVGMWVYHIWRFFRSIGIGTFNLWMHPRMYPVHDAIEYELKRVRLLKAQGRIEAEHKD